MILVVQTQCVLMRSLAILVSVKKAMNSRGTFKTAGKSMSVRESLFPATLQLTVWTLWVVLSALVTQAMLGTDRHVPCMVSQLHNYLASSQL